MGVMARRLLVFSSFTLDLDRACLMKDGVRLALRPKSMEVLQYLLERAPRLVTKDELLGAIWHDVVVGEESLTRCISDIRAVLGDRNHEIIKTVPRRGYLIDTPVDAPRATGNMAMEGPGPVHANVNTGRWNVAARGVVRPVAAIAAVLLVCVAALGIVRGLRPGLDQQEPSIAVLSFDNTSREADQAHLSSGLPEDITRRLSAFSGLRVIARQSSSRFDGTGQDARAISDQLKARYLIGGSYRREGSSVVITVNLVDGSNAENLWSQRYDRDFSDLFSVYDEVARSIVLRLTSRITQAEIERTNLKPPGSLSSYEMLLQGQHKLTQVYGRERGATLLEARELFQKALASDPRSARAMHGLAVTYLMSYLEPTSHPLLRAEYQAPSIAAKALEMSRLAVSLDGELAEARTTLARILFWRNERAESLAQYERAFVLNPNLVDPRYAMVLVHEGRIDEALAHLDRSMKVDPLYTPFTSFVMGKAHAVAGRNKEALLWLRRSTTEMPRYRPGLVWLAVSAAGDGLSDEASRASAQVRAIDPTFSAARFVADLALRDPGHKESVARRLAETGLPP